MAVVKRDERYSLSFEEWIQIKHPEIKLKDWEKQVSDIIFTPNQLGKTKLINLLFEYDYVAGNKGE